MAAASNQDDKAPLKPILKLMMMTEIQIGLMIISRYEQAHDIRHDL
jgi:hypothetical protein